MEFLPRLRLSKKEGSHLICQSSPSVFCVSVLLAYGLCIIYIQVMYIMQVYKSSRTLFEDI
ncbi:hypothetical protein RchiOBHm_Chr6g0290861 [Rosa chinensis]|uniref:Uncharacterized protein n=1 Tax=Rosa chinensis TaxID=74649 RepID=A0A2P6PVY2_ROSCH|nr:hypothetical protein RchiOBHm_Chr6g0290861 [Rosa chinensis]